jgi:hypothetical protein
MSAREAQKHFLAAASFLIAAQAFLFSQDPRSLGFKKELVIELRNPAASDLEDYPVTLNASDIRAAAPDFNSYNFALFELVGKEYRLIQTQADDLDRDRYHDEIFFQKTLPARSTTKILCYYSPKGGMQLMITPKVFARPAGGGAERQVFEWESRLSGYRLDSGRLLPYGKFAPGLVLQRARTELDRPQSWGMLLLAADSGPGAGGLCLWDGEKMIRLYGDSPADRTAEILAMGPLRTIVRVTHRSIKTPGGEVTVSARYSQAADSPVTMVTVTLEGTADRLSSGPVLAKLGEEAVVFDRDRGFFASWGKGLAGAGEIGLAVVFDPAAFAGLDESGNERGFKLRPGRDGRLAFWLSAAWGRGVTSPPNPAPKYWPERAAAVALRHSTPVEVVFTAEKR